MLNAILDMLNIVAFGVAGITIASAVHLMQEPDVFQRLQGSTALFLVGIAVLLVFEWVCEDQERGL